MRRSLLPLALALTAALTLLAGGSSAASATSSDKLVEVVVTLPRPSLAVAAAHDRALATTALRRHALVARAPAAVSYLRTLAATQHTLAARLAVAIPAASIRWHYGVALDGVSVVLPASDLARLRTLPGATVWPTVTYHTLRDVPRSSSATTANPGPSLIGATALWGQSLATAGQGVKIGLVDDGIDQAHPYFDPSGLSYPAGFPKGNTAYTTPKVIVARAFPSASTHWRYAARPFDPDFSFHATHVAGIAAGVHGVQVGPATLSGIAPNAYIGNYKALTIPTPGFGLDGNSAEIAAAIEAAVADGMDVINLSLGEPEVEPSRDLVVKALEGAAAAGVVPVIAAGNDFDEFRYGSVSSPANAPSAITVAAVTSSNAIADFSSAGPTPLSLQMKPDVAAPGVDVISSLPANQGGPFGTLSGTSMAAPVVSAAAALLKERHPTWTVAEIKSALEQTGDPIADVPVTRDGGGVIDLPRADVPLLFAAPTGLSFGALRPGATASRTVTLTDAGGGAGDWTVSGPGLTVPATVTVPGQLTVTATGAQTTGDDSGYVVLRRGADVRRIPFWFMTTAPKLAGEKALALTPGVHKGTTAGAPALVTHYRYPTGGDDSYPGPERVYRIHVPAGAANAGVAVLSGNVYPHITLDGSEDRLAGYTAMPLDLNPYRKSYGLRRRVAAVVLPAGGIYDVVFDSTNAGGRPFTFRYWVNDVAPPRLKVHSARGSIVVAATDAGSGVDPNSIAATLDGKSVATRFGSGTIRIGAAKGRHRLVLTVSDYQETKNMEDVAKILPNTTTLRATVTVR